MSAPRVLLVAHHCNPTWGSEPRIGWSWAKALGQRTEVELVTHVRNRAAIQADGGFRGVVHYVDTERLAAAVQRWNDRLWGSGSFTNRMLLDTVAQHAFDRAACRIGRERVAAGAIDVVHRVSPISPRYPSGLWRLGVPFVLGPVNGGMSTAPGFADIDRREGTRWLALRSLARGLDPLHRTVRRAAAVLVANRPTRQLVHGQGALRVLEMSENGVWPESFAPVPPRPPAAGLQVLFLGRLVAVKGLPFLVRAIAALPADVRLAVVGEGPQRAEIEQLVQQLGLGHRVQLHGQVPVHEVPAWLGRCDVLCLPSVRESGGGVVLEAAAAGLPAVVFDHGGPAELVDERSGVRVAAAGPEQLVAGLTAALLALRDDPDRRAELGAAARRRAITEFAWPRKAEAVLQLHARLLQDEARSRPARSLSSQGVCDPADSN